MRSEWNGKNNGEHELEAEFLFKSLFRKHQHGLYLTAYKVTKSPQLAADAVQEVFLKLWEHREELPFILNVEAWLNRTLKNKLIDFLRKASADTRLRSALWKEIETAQNETEQLFDAKESGTLIGNAINELPEQRRLVYRLNRETGLSYQEIAEKLSISRHTVKNQLSLALRFLQKKFSLE